MKCSQWLAQSKGLRMKFPGHRKSEHYFPVTEKLRTPLTPPPGQGGTYIVGIDQLLVDIEVHVDDDFLRAWDIPKGESVVFPEYLVEGLYQRLKKQNRIVGEYPGGAIGNTLHNFSVLADNPCFALGTISKNISVGDYAFNYICTTSAHVDFSHLQPCEGNLGRAFCFVTPDKERTFVIGKGIMNELEPNFIPENIIRDSSVLLLSSYLLRDQMSPIFQATHRAIDYAREYSVPIAFSLGTSFIVNEKRDFLLDFIRKNVSIMACNREEMHALLGAGDEKIDPLLACEKALDLADMVLLTDGPNGLYLAGHVDERNARQTKDKVYSKSIPSYNQFEYSRAMKKHDCVHPKKIYTHINPYMGGPDHIKNTNGAGDGALAAILHDMAANHHHRRALPDSSKHNDHYLTYSSIHQISKYANRVSYEVLSQDGPRLCQSLPVREDSLEQHYWDL
jgi:inosine kinase